MASAKRQYSDHDKADALAALDANAGNVAHTARQTKIPYATLVDWSKQRGISHGVMEIREEKRQALRDRLEDLAHQLAGALPDKIEKANLQQVATSLAIVIDKMLLLTGDKTGHAPDDDAKTQADRAARVTEMLAGTIAQHVARSAAVAVGDTGSDVPVHHGEGAATES